MTTQKYYGVGRIITPETGREPLPVRFTRRGKKFISQATHVYGDVINLADVFDRAHELHPMGANYAPHLNLRIQNKMIADIMAIHRVRQENIAAADHKEQRKRLEKPYHRKIVPLSALYKKNVMSQAEWNIMAERWLAIWRPSYMTAMAYSRDEKFDETPRGFVLLDIPNHKLVVDIATPMSLNQNRVPSLYTVDTASWNAFLDQGGTQESWVKGERVWKNGTSQTSILLGFAKAIKPGVITARTANIQPPKLSDSDVRQLKLFR